MSHTVANKRKRKAKALENEFLKEKTSTPRIGRVNISIPPYCRCRWLNNEIAHSEIWLKNRAKLIDLQILDKKSQQGIVALERLRLKELKGMRLQHEKEVKQVAVSVRKELDRLMIHLSDPLQFGHSTLRSLLSQLLALTATPEELQKKVKAKKDLSKEELAFLMKDIYSVNPIASHLLSTEEALSVLKIGSRRTLERLVKKGKLRKVKQGKATLYPTNSIIEYLGNLQKGEKNQ